MNKTLRPACLALLLTAGLGLAACGDKGPKTKPSEAAAAPAPKPRPDPMVVHVDAEFASRVKVGRVLTAQVADSVRLPGRVELNQYRTARIGTPVTGRVTEIDALIGQQIKNGQTLAELSSSELTTAQLNYLRATAQQQLTGRAVERARLLLASDVIGTAELQRRENELTIATSEMNAALDQLRLLGLSRDRISKLQAGGKIQPTGAISATSSGTLIERNLGIGQVVNPTDTLFVISDLSTVWAVAEVPEQDVQFVRTGQTVEVDIPALDNQRVTGKVTLVGDVVNPQTRTVRVSVDLANPDRAIKPAMLITMLIQGRTAERAVVPGSAVVRDDDQDYVFVDIGQGNFRMTPVSVSQERDGQRALLSPLPDTTRIALEGAYHLNNLREMRNTTQATAP